MNKNDERVWKYLIENRSASVEQVAHETGVTVGHVEFLIDKIGSPNWQVGYTPQVTGYPDDNPKTVYGEKKPKLSDTPTVSLRELGKVHTMGAVKYGRFNWREHTVSATVYYDAAMRHFMAWFDGEDVDPESGLSHLAHVMACASILLDAQDKEKLNDNRTEKKHALDD